MTVTINSFEGFAATGSGDAPAGKVHAVTAAGLAPFLEDLPATQARWLTDQGFTAAQGSLQALPSDDGGLAGYVFGLGEETDPLIFGKLPGALPEGIWQIMGLESRMARRRAALGWALGHYRFDRYKSKKGKALPQMLAFDDVDCDAIAQIAEGVNLARDLINVPANDMGPVALATAAASLADLHGAALTITEGDQLLTDNFPLIHAVGRAAEEAPRLIDITWGDAAAPRLTLVGKGVCFDTGGLDLKPSNAMLLMKKDMGGAANVLGLAHMVMAAKLPVRLRVLIPAVENAVAGNAFRPGDVLPSRKGISVEIGNTDAEGRLVLADALTDADSEEPDMIIDLATLTGAARVALGADVVPFYTDDNGLAEGLLDAADRVTDPAWQMPLYMPYDSQINGDTGDITNAPPGGFAGSITAALFLKRFVTQTPRWLHADIYGWSPATLSGVPKGGRAQLIRALFEVIKSRYA